MKQVLGIISALCMLGFVHASPVHAETKLVVGDVAPLSAAWPSYVAAEKGLFRAQGLDASIIYAGSAANVVQQLIGGAFDIGLSTFDTAVRAAAGGAPIAVIGATTVKYPYSIMVAPEIKSARDLRGKTIILPFQKDITTVLWNRWLKDQGVDPASVDQVYDGASANRFAALSAKRVQAAFLGAPFDLRAQQDGYGKLLDYSNYAKGFPFTVVIVRRDWLRDHEDTARHFLAALAASEKWITNEANRDEASDVLARATKQSKDLALQTYDYFVKEAGVFNPELRFPADAATTVGQVLVDLGDIRSVSAVPADLIDFRLLGQ